MYDLDEECKAMVEKLNNICRMKNISLRTLAKKSKVSTSTISCLLNGKTKPHIYTLLSICNVLEISIYELFDDGGMAKTDTESLMLEVTKVEQTLSESESLGLSDAEKELLLCYRHLSDGKKSLLKVFIDTLLQYAE